jgi:chitinase
MDYHRRFGCRFLRFAAAAAGRVSVVMLSLGFLAGWSQELRVVGYVPTWSDLPRLTVTLPFQRLTHLNLAFVNPTTAEGELEVPAGAAALVARAKAQGVRVLVSLGGGSASEDGVMRARYLALIAPARRTAFITTIMAYVDTQGYDGVDVDLEGPAITDDYGGFIADLAASLQARGKLLSAALSSGYGGGRILPATLALFSYLNLMAYDATGPWTPDRPGPHASLEHATHEVAFWRARGVPADRLVLGVPFYGYAFNADRSVTAWSYRKIVEANLGAQEHDQIGTLYYDGFPAVRSKAALITREGLGGAMIWSLDQDIADARSLLAELARALGR